MAHNPAWRYGEQKGSRAWRDSRQDYGSYHNDHDEECDAGNASAGYACPVGDGSLLIDRTAFDVTRQSAVEIDWPPEWHAQAACLEADPEAFFPSGKRKGTERKKQIAYCKWFCERCPVREICLAENMTVPYGIFGGMTVSERYRELGWDGNPNTRPDKTISAFFNSVELFIVSGQVRYRAKRAPKKSSQKSEH